MKMKYYCCILLIILILALSGCSTKYTLSNTDLSTTGEQNTQKYSTLCAETDTDLGNESQPQESYKGNRTNINDNANAEKTSNSYEISTTIATLSGNEESTYDSANKNGIELSDDIW